MNKDIKKILIVLGLYSAAGGLFYSFQELWMQSNNLSITTIGNVFSICAILSVSIIFLCSSLINQHRLKKLEMGLILLKFISILLLFFLNGTEYHILIKFLIMLDYVADVEIYACIYPMLSMIQKEDKLYAKRSLIYTFCYNIGTLIAGLLLGRFLFDFRIDYNFFLLIAAILMFLAFVFLKSINLDKYIGKNEKVNNDNLLLQLLKNIKEDKISVFYLLFILIGEISYYSVMGLIVIVMANYFNFSDSIISIFSIVTGLIAAGVGSVILAKLTFKNDYINVVIKFGGRLLFYLLAVILNNKIVFSIAFLYILLFSESYINITDGQFVNRFDDEYQLAFCNLKEMVSYLGRAIGTFLCGICFVVSIRLNFAVASVFILGQIIFICLAIHSKKKEN